MNRLRTNCEHSAILVSISLPTMYLADKAGCWCNRKLEMHFSKLRTKYDAPGGTRSGEQSHRSLPTLGVFISLCWLVACLVWLDEVSFWGPHYPRTCCLSVFTSPSPVLGLQVWTPCLALTGSKCPSCFAAQWELTLPPEVHHVTPILLSTSHFLLLSPCQRYSFYFCFIRETGSHVAQKASDIWP